MQQVLEKLSLVSRSTFRLKFGIFLPPDGSNPEPAIKFGAILAMVFSAVFEADCYKKNKTIDL